MRQVILLTLLAVTGCSSNIHDVNGAGRIFIDADAEGMRAFSDYTQGAITNGKAEAGSDTPYWEHRRLQTKGRFTSKGGTK